MASDAPPPCRIRRAVLAAWLAALALGAAGCATGGPDAPTEVVVYAAAGLRPVLTPIAEAFEARAPTVKLRLVFGSAAVLRDRLLSGEQANVFASTELEHPGALAAAGRGGPVETFALDGLCVLAAPGVDIDASRVLDRLFDPLVRIAAVVPGADPPGSDVTSAAVWTLYRHIDRQRPGAFARLDRKTAKLRGAAAASRAAGGAPVLGDEAALLAEGRADVLLTRCALARQARADRPALQVVALPADVDVAARYGVVWLKPGRPLAHGDAARDVAQALERAGKAAQGFIAALRGPTGRAVLEAASLAVP